MNCCACQSQPAVIFGVCMDCYWSGPPAYLAACARARLRGEPHPEEAREASLALCRRNQAHGATRKSICP